MRNQDDAMHEEESEEDEEDDDDNDSEEDSEEISKLDQLQLKTQDQSPFTPEETNEYQQLARKHLQKT